jgi:hypothetical protein
MAARVSGRFVYGRMVVLSRVPRSSRPFAAFGSAFAADVAAFRFGVNGFLG